MGDGIWLTGYAGQTTDELLALEGAFRADSMALAFEQAWRLKAESFGRARLSESERVVLAAEALEREVDSGGYDALFSQAPEAVPDLAMALTAIGADAVAGPTESAIAVLGVEGLLTREAVTAAASNEERQAERDERLATIDEAYGRLGVDLAEPPMAFIRAHRDEVVLTAHEPAKPTAHRLGGVIRSLFSRP